MAIVWTNWTTGTDAGVPFTTVWGASADALKGRTDGWRHLNALGQACNERGEWIYSNPPTGYTTPAYTVLAEYGGKPPNGWDGYDYAVQIESAIDTLLGTAGTWTGGWVDWTDNAGEWDGQSTIPRWSTRQDIIDYYIAQGDMPVGTTPETLGRGYLSREWVWQTYMILDAMRWFSGLGETFGGASAQTMYFGGTQYTKYVYSGVSWAAAQSSFSSASYSSGALSSAPTVTHFALRSDSPQWDIQRDYASANISQIGTNIAHQLVWYRKAEKIDETFVTYNQNDYQDNDGSATENTFYKLHESTVATTATRSSIQLGDNSAASSVTEPAAPGVGEQNARGYTYGNGINESDPVVIWKLDVTGGLTFVT